MGLLQVRLKSLGSSSGREGSGAGDFRLPSLPPPWLHSSQGGWSRRRMFCFCQSPTASLVGGF